MNVAPYHLTDNGVTICGCPNDGRSDLPKSDLDIRNLCTFRYSDETRGRRCWTNGISSSGPTLNVAPRDLAMVMLWRMRSKLP